MSEAPNPPTRKQHFVPLFYLKRFANPKGFVETYNVRRKKIEGARPVAGVGYAEFFYAAKTGKPDQVSQAVEQWLGAHESDIARELPAIITRVLGQEQIRGSDRYILALLMCLLWLRSPTMRSQLNDLEEQFTKSVMSRFADERVDRYLAETGQSITAEARQDLIDTFKKGAYELSYGNGQHLRFMTENLGSDGPGFTNLFLGHKWKIYVARGKKRFITSDSPVVELSPPTREFYGNTFLQRPKYFPLTPEILLELTYPVGSGKAKRVTLFEGDDEEVSKLNILIAAHSEERVFSHDKSLLTSLAEGRQNPGRVERKYYEQFERPHEEERLRRASLTRRPNFQF